MPKGALLHAHLDATVHKTTLMKMAYHHPEIHISVPQRITPTNIRHTLPLLRVFPQSQFTGVISVTDVKYQYGSWIPLCIARDAFESALGGPEGFDEWLYRCMTIDPAEAYGSHNTVEKVGTS